MGVVRSGLRRVAEALARRVARDELFEKPGERAPTGPLPPAAPQPEPTAKEPAPSKKPATLGQDQ